MDHPAVVTFLILAAKTLDTPVVPGHEATDVRVVEVN